MDRLTIFPKGLVLIAVPLCFQLAFIALVARMRHDNIAAERWMIHSNEVIAQAEACGYRILSTHGAVQGYIITRDPTFGAEVRRLNAIARVNLQRLVELVAASPAQTKAATAVQDRAVLLLDFIKQGAEIVDGPGMPPDEAATRRRHAQSLLEDLRLELNRFTDVERALSSEKHERLVAAWSQLDRLLGAGFIVSILSSLLIALLFARSISGRIKTLATNARLLGQGDDLMPPLRGHDELARLDTLMREMARTLARTSAREKLATATASQRAEEMVQINEQLREKAQENEMFVYSVSHDLRSPLVNLQGFSKELGLIGMDLLRTVDRDGVPDDVRRQTRSLIEVEMGESVGFIQSAVSRLSSIIDALLRLSRAGRVEYHPQAVDPDPIVARIIAALRGTIDERQATVTASPLPPCHADPTVVEQILANLIGNAVNYLDPTRPGQVTVFHVDPVPHQGEAVAGSVVVYAVRDNGLGIPDAYQGKIFTAFQRLHGDVARGEGIGLALVRRMVERHGGRVWFESQAGRGTTFFVALPAFIKPAVVQLRANAADAVADGLQEKI